MAAVAVVERTGAVVAVTREVCSRVPSFSEGLRRFGQVLGNVRRRGRRHCLLISDESGGGVVVGAQVVPGG